MEDFCILFELPFYISAKYVGDLSDFFSFNMICVFVYDSLFSVVLKNISA